MTNSTIRKQRQRQREQAEGLAVISFKVTQDHKKRIEATACARGYDVNEYISLLTHRDSQAVDGLISDLGSCDFCGNELPGGCVDDMHKGHGECWKTSKRREVLSL